ncbi:MAG: hypothetical protein V1879_05065 [Pseudomonadota bacterium]
MNTITYGLLFAGVSSILLGIFHLPRIWGMVFTTWHAEIDSLSPLNRKLVNTVFIALCFALLAFGTLTLLLAGGDSRSDGFRIWFLALCLLFWIWRLIWQFVYFPYRKLKPGSRLLSLHVGLIVIFAVDVVAYAVPVFLALMST